MTSERERAWSELHATTPPGWYVGTPVYHVERQQWAMYAFDTMEKAHIGKRSGEWTGRADRDDGRARDGAVPREIAADRVPR